MPEEINFTYEVLFELVMREKSREDLQKLPSDFADQAVGYFNKKRTLAIDRPDDEREAMERQANNSLRLIKDLYDRREKKLVNIAILKVRADNSVIDYSAMLDEERQFFESMVALMKSHRQVILTARLEKVRPLKRVIVAQQAQAQEVEQEPSHSDEQHASKLVRFLNPVPKFVGKELEVYGPFEQEELASLPAEIADILISKGRAEEVSGN